MTKSELETEIKQIRLKQDNCCRNTARSYLAARLKYLQDLQKSRQSMCCYSNKK